MLSSKTTRHVAAQQRRAKRKKVTPPALAPLEQAFHDKLLACLPQERRFVEALLTGVSKTDAAIAAGYSERSAERQAWQVWRRLRVKEAFEAGQAAIGYGPEEVLRRVAAFGRFDPASVMSYVHETVTDQVERPAAEVSAELQRDIDTARTFLANLLVEQDLPDDHPAARRIEQRITAMRLQQLELEMLLARDEQATTIVPIERLVRVPYVDLDKVQQQGAMRYVQAVRLTKFGRQVELASEKDRLDISGKATGIFREGLEVTGKDGQPLETGAATVIVLPGNGRDHA